jgi:hypothetical protein
MRIPENLKHLHQTVYQRIAAQTDTTTRYVGMIARGHRTPTRGKGLLVKQKLDEL